MPDLQNMGNLEIDILIRLIKIGFHNMKISIVIVVAVLLLPTFSYDKDLDRFPLEEWSRPFSATFAATWLGGFCYRLTGPHIKSVHRSGGKRLTKIRCDEQKINLWDRWLLNYLESPLLFTDFGQAVGRKDIMGIFPWGMLNIHSLSTTRWETTGLHSHTRKKMWIRFGCINMINMEKTLRT